MSKRIKTRKVGVKVPTSIKRAFPHVKEVLDAVEPVEVHVSSTDCKKAVGLDPTECAMAKAVKREFHADGAIIGMSTSYIIRGNKALRFNTPQSVQREIVSFDRHQDFEPGEYYLMPKPATKRLGSGSYNYSKNKPSGSKKHRKYNKTMKIRTLPTGAEISE
jgi:hypothetical protein